MPYKSFRELAGESGSVNSAFQTSYSKTFLIEVDSATDSVFYVGSHPQLPLLYSQHPADNRAYCVSINPQQDSSNPLIWRVTCQWSMTLDAAGVGGMPVASGNPYVDSQQAGKAPADRQQAPLVRGNDYSYESIVIGKEVVEYESIPDPLDPNSIVINKWFKNTAGDVFESLPERDIYGLQVTVGRNLPGAPAPEWDTLNGKLNSAQITVGTRVCPAKTVMMMGTSATLVYENSAAYWRWTHRLVIRPAKSWLWKPLNKGKNGILPLRDGPGAGAAIVYKIGNIQKMFRHLSGDQVMDKNSYPLSIFPKDGAVDRKPHYLEFEYLETATFPAVL